MLDKFAISTDQVAMIIADAREDAIVGERERIIKLLTEFNSQFSIDSKTPLEKMMVENYQMISLFIVGLIKDDVDNFIPNAIAFIKKGNK